jgi:lipopolysaccharide export LptBFGC system permease protein LptF
LGFILSLCLYLINAKIDPYFHYRYRTQMKNIYTKNITSLIEPGVFLEGFGNYIIRVSDKDGNKLKNVFIYEVNEKESTSKVTYAKKGEFAVDKDILKLKLENGFRDESATGEKKELYRLNFEVFFIDIPLGDKKAIKVDKKPADMTVRELREKIKYLRKMGIEAEELVGEIHKRISLSFSTIAFAILGFAVSLSVRHREKSINFGIAFFTALTYFLLPIPAEALVESHVIPATLGMWLPNIIIFPLAGFLIFRNAYFR